MMWRRALLLGTLGLFTAAGCSSPVYRPFKGGVGYSEAQLGPDVYDVAYEGTESMSIGRATELAKVRAAELTLLRSKSHFRVLDRNNSTRIESERHGPYYGGGYNDFGHRGYGTGVGVGVTFGGGAEIESRPTTVLRVELLDAPAEGAFNARQVLDDVVARGLVPAEELAFVPPVQPATRPR